VGITRAERDLYITFARSRTVFGARNYGLASRFIAEIPAELTDRRQQPQAYGGIRGRATSWSSPATERSWPASERDAPIAYRLGDDVAHPKFGEGVVTAVEPGGIVVIHFRKDGTDRKLVADLAPISKR
jgi:DNA helicase-2/ATP-dependent DNA helicase PcrA